MGPLLGPVLDPHFGRIPMCHSDDATISQYLLRVGSWRTGTYPSYDLSEGQNGPSTGTWSGHPQIHDLGMCSLCRIVYGYGPLHIQHVLVLSEDPQDPSKRGSKTGSKTGHFGDPFEGSI